MSEEAQAKRPKAEPNAFAVLLGGRRLSATATTRARPKGGADQGSRLVQCPCCGTHVHRLLINDHIERCTGRPSPAPAFERLQAAAPPGPSGAGPSSAGPSGSNDAALVEGDEASSRVPCPMCGLELAHADVFSHLDVCKGCTPQTAAPPAAPPDAPPAAPSPALTATSLVSCPACSAEMTLDLLNKHLDAGCDGGARAEPESTPAETAAPDSGDGHVDDGGGSEAPAEESRGAAAPPAGSGSQGGGEPRASAGLDQMAQELTCRICFDIYESPHSLPCQHSFCHECILGCFKVTRAMQCPLCKAPVWRRQLAPNHQIASIVEVFRRMQRAGEGDSEQRPPDG